MRCALNAPARETIARSTRRSNTGRAMQHRRALTHAAPRDGETIFGLSVLVAAHYSGPALVPASEATRVRYPPLNGGFRSSPAGSTPIA